MLLELVLPIIVAWGMCYRRRGKKKRIFKVEEGIVKIYSGSEVWFVGGITISDIDPVRLYGEYFEVMRQYSYALQRSAQSMVLEVRLIKRPISQASVLSKLEREITSLRVLKMSDPTDAKVERKLKVLEKMYKVLSEGTPPVSVQVYYILYSQDLERLRSEMQFLGTMLENLLGAKVETVSTRTLMRMINLEILKMKHDIIATSEMLSLVPPMQKSSVVSGVYIGRDSVGEPVFISKDELLHHLMVTGATGSGKSTFLAVLALRAEALLSIENITIIDPKGDLSNIIEQIGNGASVYRFVGDPRRREEEVTRYVESVVSRIVNEEPTKEIRELVLIDEAWIVDKRVLEELVREGRSKGVAVVIASQSPSDFDEIVLSNVHSFISFKVNDVKEGSFLCRVFGEKCEALRSLPRGEALFKSWKGEVKRIYVDAEEVLQALTETTLKSSTPQSSSALLTSFGSAGSSSRNT